MKIMIKDLKKNDKFIFNNKIYIVRKKYRNDDSPLITNCGELFHYDELEVVQQDVAPKV